MAEAQSGWATCLLFWTRWDGWTGPV